MEASEAIRIARSTRHISGWITEEAALLFALLDAAQKAAGIDGRLFEIGVHHGKSAILLGNLASRSGEKLGVCDIFGGQHDNLSNSGSGDRGIFEANLAKHCPPGLKCVVYQKLSSALTQDEIGEDYRLFHIDGGHSTEEALSDLELAANCLTEGGVVILDDAFNPPWPGVTEAAVLFLQQRSDFAPVCIGFNKLLLTRASNADRYCQLLDNRVVRKQYLLDLPWQLKTLNFTGRPTQIFYWPTTIKRRTLKQRFWREREANPVLRRIPRRNSQPHHIFDQFASADWSHISG